MTDPSYAAASKAMANALQAYTQQRHPYTRAADEIDLALNSQHVQEAKHLQQKHSTSQGSSAAKHHDANDEL
jgi:hypothetical protein